MFRSLLEYDLGVTVDNDWNLTGSILVEDWGGFFSDPLRNKLSPKGRTLYKKLLRELSQNENLFRCKNLTEISPVAKRLLREADSTDCLTREGRILLRKEAREHRLFTLIFQRLDQLDQEKPGQSRSLAGKLMLLFVSLDAIRKSLRTLPRFQGIRRAS